VIMVAEGRARHCSRRRSFARKLLLFLQCGHLSHLAETSNPIYFLSAVQWIVSTDFDNFP